MGARVIPSIIFHFFVVCAIINIVTASFWTDIIKEETDSRVAHTTQVYADARTDDTLIIVFGGDSIMNDTVQGEEILYPRLSSVKSFSTKNKTWTILSDPRTLPPVPWGAPSVRDMHAATIVPSDAPYYASCMFIFGGQYDLQEEPLGIRPVMIAFNLSNNEWIISNDSTWLKDPQLYKDRRASAFHYSKLDHSLVLFGGGGVTAFSDTNKYFLGNNTWIKVVRDGETSPDRIAEMASTTTPDGKYMYVYGGSISSGLWTRYNYHKRLWRFDMVNNRWELMPDSLNRFPSTPQGGLLFYVSNINTLWLIPFVADGYSDMRVELRNSSKWHAFQYHIDTGSWLDDPIPSGGAIDPTWSLWYGGGLVEDSSGIHYAVLTGGQIYPNNIFTPEKTVRYLQFVAAPLPVFTTDENDNKKTNHHLIAIIVPSVLVPLVALVMVVGLILFLRKRAETRSNLLLMEMEQQQGGGVAPLEKNNDLSGSAITDIVIQSRIGGGNFGDVYKGLWQGSTPVACKMLKNQDHIKSFEQEAKMLKQLRHPNVVQFFGIYTESSTGKRYIVTEYLPQGSLAGFLAITPNLTIEQRLNMCKDAAAGMLYISEVHHLVHRDIALRNLLIVNKEGQYVVKISDLGLTRELNKEGHYVANEIAIPIKWTAPEAIKYRTFNDKSDVWSFGITMWEIMSYGQQPYKDLTNEQTLEKIMSGYRLPLPSENTPTVIYELMLQCWREDPAERPSFKTIHSTIASYH